MRRAQAARVPGAEERHLGRRPHLRSRVTEKGEKGEGKKRGGEGGAHVGKKRGLASPPLSLKF